jgi:hypothetical protein
MKQTKIYYDELKHITQKNEVFKYSEIFRKSKEYLEQITKQPLKSITEFHNDMELYSIKEIKNSFPKPFELGLELDVTLSMIKIDIKPIIEAQSKLMLCKLPTKLVNGVLELDKNDSDFFVYLNPSKQEEYNSIIGVIENFKKIDRYNNTFLVFKALGTDRTRLKGYNIEINPTYFST